MWPKPLQGKRVVSPCSFYLQCSRSSNVPAVVASLATAKAAALVPTGTALRAVSANVTVLAASVALAGRGAAVAVTRGSFGALGRDVARLVALRER